jgi:hypothetical protein
MLDYGICPVCALAAPTLQAYRIECPWPGVAWLMSRAALLADLQEYLSGHTAVRNNFLQDALRRRDVRALADAVCDEPLDRALWSRIPSTVPLQSLAPELNRILGWCDIAEHDIVALWNFFHPSESGDQASEARPLVALAPLLGLPTRLRQQVPCAMPDFRQQATTGAMCDANLDV